MNTLTVVFAVLWGTCEVLAAIPSVKSNSVFQLIKSTITLLMNLNNRPPTPPTPPESGGQP